MMTPETLAQLTQARQLIDDVLARDRATAPPSSSYQLVRQGDNLPSLIEMASLDARFKLEAGYRWSGDITFAKPAMFEANSPLGDVELAGSHVVTAPDVYFNGLRFVGDTPERTILTTGLRTIIVDCTLVGSALGQKRGIAVNSAGVRILHTNIENIWHQDDAQAICGWDGTRDLLVDSCTLEASGENIMFGGADPTSIAAIPQDIQIIDCILHKPLRWRGKSGLTAKNLFEVKNAKRVLLRGCVLEYSWAGGQTGFALVFTVRNQSGTAPYSTIEDVVIEHNTVRHMGSGVQILGRDDEQASQILRGLTIQNNTFEDIDPVQWGGDGRQVFISGGPRDVTIAGNTFTGQHVNTFLSFDQVQFPSVNLRVVGNRAMEGSYGVIGTNGTPGVKSLEQFAPGYTWADNTLVRTGVDNIAYPPGTTIV